MLSPQNIIKKSYSKQKLTDKEFENFNKEIYALYKPY